MKERSHLLLLALVFLSLLGALWAGLIRIGWAWPPLRPSLPGVHGPLMVSGFLGTLISLERAVALHKGWLNLAPLLTGLGSAFMILGLPNPIGPLLITLGSLLLVVVSVSMVRRQPALFTATMGLGVVSWSLGNGLWLGARPVAEAVPWWAGFLVLTIVGERLELSRVARLPSRSHQWFALAVGLFMAGLLLSILAYAAGVRVAGLGMIALALWLMRFDVARRTIRRAGLTRFIAVNLLLGYVWLVIAGILAVRFAGVTAGVAYDAWLHSLFLGFVFAMIFAHAPIILPAVSGLPIPFHRLLYGPTLVMHLALLMRLVGDLLPWLAGRQWGGLLNALAILGFLLLMAALTARERFLGRGLSSVSDPL